MKEQSSHLDPQLPDLRDHSCSQACRAVAHESVLSGFIGRKKAQRWGVPGPAAGLTLAPSVSLPAAWGLPPPATQDCLHAGFGKAQLPKAAVWGPSHSPRARWSPRRVRRRSPKPSPLLVGNSKHPGTSGLGNRAAVPAGQSLVNRFSSGVRPVP